MNGFDKIMIIYIIIYFICFISLLFSIELNVTSEMNDTYNFCCEGNVCSDTYYDQEKDLCILALTNNTYKPRGVNNEI